MGVTDNQFTQAAKDAENEAATTAKAAEITNGAPTTSAPAAVTVPGAPVIQAPSVAEKDAVAVATSLQDKVGNWLKDVYNSNKFLFYTIIPLMGIIYVVIKFHNILINILLGSAKEEISQAQATDAKLAQQADATKSQADALVQQAQDTTATTPVDPDWDKK